MERFDSRCSIVAKINVVSTAASGTEAFRAVASHVYNLAPVCLNRVFLSSLNVSFNRLRGRFSRERHQLERASARLICCEVTTFRRNLAQLKRIRVKVSEFSVLVLGLAKSDGNLPILSRCRSEVSLTFSNSLLDILSRWVWPIIVQVSVSAGELKPLMGQSELIQFGRVANLRSSKVDPSNPF